MTLRPGTHLRFDPDFGVFHVHSDEELAANTWRVGADCEDCPERLWDSDGEKTQPVTNAQRKRRVP